MSSKNQDKMFTLIEQRLPDQNVRDFCKAHNIAEGTFYYWQKKYKEHRDVKTEPTFIPLQVSGSMASALATIQLPGGSVITLYHAEAFSYIHPLL